jgi:hypothetical protein
MSVKINFLSLHKGNANQKHVEILDGYHQEHKQKCWKGCGIKGTLMQNGVYSGGEVGADGPNNVYTCK